MTKNLLPARWIRSSDDSATSAFDPLARPVISGCRFFFFFFFVRSSDLINLTIPGVGDAPDCSAGVVGHK